MERSPLAQRRLVEAWESGDPVHGASMSFNEWVRAMRRNERNGTGVVFAIEHHGRIVGQISLGAICYGAMRTGVVGYWSMNGVRGMDMRRWLLRYWLIGRCSTFRTAIASCGDRLASRKRTFT